MRALDGVCLAVALGAAVAIAARGHRHEHVSPTFAVPRVAHDPVVDGELADVVWLTEARRSGAFSDVRGGTLPPFSEARFAWRGDDLLFAFYAADLDINVSPVESPIDRFLLEIEAGGRSYRAMFGPDGKVVAAPGVPESERGTSVRWVRDVKVATEADGTVERPGDFDEEWTIEATLPLRALRLEARPGQKFRARVSRCDVPLDGKVACRAWPSASEFARLELAP